MLKEMNRKIRLTDLMTSLNVTVIALIIDSLLYPKIILLPDRILIHGKQAEPDQDSEFEITEKGKKDSRN